MDGARQAKVYPGALGLDEPVSWDQLVAYVKEGSVDALGNMGRGKASQNTYAAFKAKVSQDHASMADYIKCTVLGYETVADSTGRKTAIGLPPGAPDPAVSFQPNDFPYLCEPGVEHHCLWASRPLSVEEVEQLLSKCRAGYEVVRFVNPVQLASIPAVWHCHVLSRRRPCGSPQVAFIAEAHWRFT